MAWSSVTSMIPVTFSIARISSGVNRDLATMGRINLPFYKIHLTSMV